MSNFLLIATFYLILQTSYGYILLTANMEDVQALAKQFSDSPVVGQLNKIWRRASSQFRKELNTRRHDDASVIKGGKEDLNAELDRRTKSIVKDLVALGKSSGYLEPIKQVLGAM